MDECAEFEGNSGLGRAGDAEWERTSCLTYIRKQFYGRGWG